MQNDVHYFDIEGMSCSSCVFLIEDTLLSEKYIKEVNINLVTNRARVVTEKNVKPKNIIKAIESIREKKFRATSIPQINEKTFYFSIENLSSVADANKIQQALKKNKAFVKDCEINYSTKTASMVVYTDDNTEKNQKLREQIKADIQSIISDHKVIIKDIVPPIKAEEGINEPKSYFYRALMNAVVGLPLIVLGHFIPLPLTLAGQLIGLMIGGATLGIMHQTGKEFYQSAWREFISKRSSNMNTLIALGTGSAWVYSMMLVLAPMLFVATALHYQFLAVVMILGIVNLGKGIRAHAQKKSKDIAQSLAQVYVSLQPQIAQRVNLKNKKDLFQRTDLNDHVEHVHYLKIKQGDIIQVKPDERFPVEGIIVNDVETFVSQETLTGEPRPCNKKKGDKVFSGSLNRKNTAYICATCNGSEGHLTRVIEDVAKSSSSKPSISKLVDKLAFVFVPTIIGLSCASGLVWLAFGATLAVAIKCAMAVLLCACPCALVLATPISTTISMYQLFNRGILVHDATALEAAANIDTFVFDKTGTLTDLKLDDVYIGKTRKRAEETKEAILKYVASLETGCLKAGYDHPIARSFVTENSFMSLYPCRNAEKSEQGVSGRVKGKTVLLGSLSHLQTNGVKVPKHFQDREDDNAHGGATSVYVAIGNKCVGLIGLKHDIRKDAKKAIAGLLAMGIDVFMLTGDKKDPAQIVAEKLGIKKVFSERNSDMKEKFIRNLKNTRKCVAFVGDGINDLKAINAADVGIALGSWTHASSSAHIALQRLNLIEMIIIAKQTMRNIHQNLWWTGFYNVFSLVAATGLLVPIFGFALNPVVASLSMALSSIIVVINSWRLTKEIDLALQGPQPKTYFQKFKKFISLSTLYYALRELFNLNHKNPHSKPNTNRSRFEEDYGAKESNRMVPHFELSYPNGLKGSDPSRDNNSEPEIIYSRVRRKF